MLAVNEEIKSQIFVYWLNILSGVTNERCPPWLCARAHSTLRLQKRWVIDNVWEILSSRDLNPILSAPEANVLPPCTICPVDEKQKKKFVKKYVNCVI